MNPDDAFRKLREKVEKMTADGSYDLPLEEDLWFAVMNLISLEEHFFMTAEKTGKDSYLELLKQTREVRKKLLARISDTFEGETWCISKHLLAATMRLMEVGTKYQTEKKDREAKKMFDLAYKVFSLFWGVRLKLVDLSKVKKIPEGKLNVHDRTSASDPWSLEEVIAKLVDCCKE